MNIEAFNQKQFFMKKDIFYLGQIQICLYEKKPNNLNTQTSMINVS